MTPKDKQGEVRRGKGSRAGQDVGRMTESMPKADCKGRLFPKDKQREVWKGTGACAPMRARVRGAWASGQLMRVCVYRAAGLPHAGVGQWRPVC